MPSVTPRAEDGLWDHLRKSVADRTALAQRQTWAIQDGTRPPLSPLVNSGIGSTVPETSTFGDPVTFPPITIAWDDTPTVGNLLVGMCVTPNSSAPTSLGPVTDWTGPVTGTDGNDGGLYWRISDGTSADTTFTLTDAQPQMIGSYGNNYTEVLMVATWEVTAGSYVETSGVPYFSGYGEAYQDIGPPGPPWGIAETTIATPNQLLLYCVNMAENTDATGTMTIEDTAPTPSVAWPLNQSILQPEECNYGYYGIYAGYLLTDVYDAGSTAIPVASTTGVSEHTQMVSYVVLLTIIPVMPTSTQQTVMHIGQLPSNTPTESPPNPALPSPNWVSPSRPLHGIQIISDKAEVIFQADQEHGCVFIDGGGA